MERDIVELRRGSLLKYRVSRRTTGTSLTAACLRIEPGRMSTPETFHTIRMGRVRQTGITRFGATRDRAIAVHSPVKFSFWHGGQGTIQRFQFFTKRGVHIVDIGLWRKRQGETEGCSGSRRRRLVDVMTNGILLIRMKVFGLLGVVRVETDLLRRKR